MKTSPPRLAVVGSANMDLTFRTPRLPKPGETLTGQAFHLGYGGKGANQAVMAARFGAKVTMLAKVGSDVFGEGMKRQLHTEGIDITQVLTDPVQFSGVAGIVVDDAAQNCIIVVPGANHALTPADVENAAATLQAASVLLCQLEVPLPTTLAALRLAKAAGVKTILNPAPAQPLTDEMLALADLCIPNETELELLTGHTAATLKEAEAAAHILLQRGPSTVIVTLGNRGTLIVDTQTVERGALIVTDLTVEHVPPFKVIAVDPTGAGDAFIGSLGVLLAEGMLLREAVRQASATAALSVTRPGAQQSFPTRREVAAFLANG
jgi:ribokinase